MMMEGGGVSHTTFPHSCWSSSTSKGCSRSCSRAGGGERTAEQEWESITKLKIPETIKGDELNLRSSLSWSCQGPPQIPAFLQWKREFLWHFHQQGWCWERNFASKCSPDTKEGLKGLLSQRKEGWVGSDQWATKDCQSQQTSLGWLQHPGVRIPLLEVFLKISRGKPGLKNSEERGEHIDLLELLIQVHKTGRREG